jgi:nicotinamide riboside transporter PnuC
VTWLLTALSIVGVILNTRQDRRCFYIWIVTNSCWAVLDFAKGLPAQGTMFLLYLGLSGWGLYQWRHKASSSRQAVCQQCGEVV